MIFRILYNLFWPSLLKSEKYYLIECEALTVKEMLHSVSFMAIWYAALNLEKEGLFFDCLKKATLKAKMINLAPGKYAIAKSRFIFYKGQKFKLPEIEITPECFEVKDFIL